MLSGPEVFRPLPVKVKFRFGAVGPALSLVARSCAESLPGGLGGAWVSPLVPGMLVWHV